MAAAQGKGGVGDGDGERLRQKLAARVVDCFDRLEDVVSELVALHSVDPDEILACVRETIEWELSEGESSASG